REAHEEDGREDRPFRPDRGERGVRCAGARRRRRAGLELGPRQRERRRGGVGPPDRGERRARAGDAAARARGTRQEDRSRHAVPGRRQRRGARGGARLMAAPTSETAATVSAHIKKVAVVGGGTMGNGIAQVFATSGFDVALVDAKPEFVERALATTAKNLDRVAKKLGWDETRAKGILGRIGGGTTLEAARDCSLIVEAVTESFELKKQIFTTLDAVAPANAILA